MKYNKTFLTILVVMVSILLLTFFAGKINFYSFDTSVEGMNFKYSNNSKSDVPSQLLWFTYDNNYLNLNSNMLVDSKSMYVYALSGEAVTESKVSSFKTAAGQNGSFIATLPKLDIDFNSDGSKETVYSFAKTDSIATQGFAPVRTIFKDPAIPFELHFVNRNAITVYYNQNLLANTELIVNTMNYKNLKLKTDSSGIIQDLPLKEIRSGINVTYINPDNTYYTMSYQVEDNTLFGKRHRQALMPFFYILLASLLAITIISAVRNRKGIVLGFKRFNFSDTFASLWDIICGFFDRFKKFKIDFITVRWFCMTAYFILMIYGTQLFGRWFSSVEIPVFACPQNQDQFINSSCYSLSHWNYLFGEHTVAQITIFFICLLASIILLGRAVCGFLCPFGLLQDLVYEIRQIFRIRGISFNEKIYNLLKLIKWELLIIFLGAWAIGLDFCNFCPAITLSPAFAGFKLSIYISGFIAIIAIVLSFFKRRFWCNICPLGYIIGLFQKLSLFRLKKNCQSCTECGACYEACPMGIKSIYTERSKIDITTSNCIMCGECIKKCPENDALSIAIAGKKIYTASRFQFFSKKRK